MRMNKQQSYRASSPKTLAAATTDKKAAAQMKYGLTLALYLALLGGVIAATTRCSGRQAPKTPLEAATLAQCFSDNNDGLQSEESVKDWCRCMYDRLPKKSTEDDIADFEDTPEGGKADDECAKKAGYED